MITPSWLVVIAAEWEVVDGTDGHSVLSGLQCSHLHAWPASGSRARLVPCHSARCCWNGKTGKLWVHHQQVGCFSPLYIWILLLCDCYNSWSNCCSLTAVINSHPGQLSLAIHLWRHGALSWNNLVRYCKQNLNQADCCMRLFQSVARFTKVGLHGIWFYECPDKYVYEFFICVSEYTIV